MKPVQAHAEGTGAGASGELVHEPRWPALIAIVTAGLLYGALPSSLLVGPSWLLIVLIVVLEIPTMVAHYQGAYRVNRVLGFAVSGVLTAFLAASVALLVVSLPAHKETPVQILESAACLWVSNIIVFAQWYWRLDAGGPYERAAREHHPGRAAFLFPQLTLKEGPKGWRPQFVDYLFLAFNTSTALSPTDAPVLNRWAKLLTMIQSVISLTVIALLLARAVNIM